MKQQIDQPPRECLFAQRYLAEDGEIFVAVYRFKGRLLLVTSKERGGDIEVELSDEDATGLVAALEAGQKK